jgi:hypothetical protein
MATMLSWSNLADAAQEITATREATGLGVRNLLTEPVAEVWRVPEVAAATVTDLDVTLPAAAAIGVVALFAPRDGYLPPGYTVELMASTVSIGATDVLSVAAAPLALSTGRGAWWHWPAAAITARYLRLRFTSVTGDAYLQFGRLWIGPDFRPTYGADGPGQRMGAGGAGLVERASISGIVSASRGALYRMPSFVLPLLTSAEAESLQDAALAVGTQGQVVVNPRTQDGAKSLVLGRLADAPQPERIAPRRWRAGITVMEDL